MGLKGYQYKCLYPVKKFITGEICECVEVSSTDVSLKTALGSIQSISKEDLTKYFAILEPSIDNIKDDRVNSPKHYTWLKDLCGIEPIDICRHLNFNEGNICKYLLRRGKEDIISLQEKRIEDLKKIIYYANDEIKRLELCTK